MSDAWRYAAWPDARSWSRSRAFQIWKSRRFQHHLSTPPFTMGAGNWQRILKLRHIFKFGRSGFFIFGLVFVSRDFQVGTNVSCEKSTVSPLTGLILKVRINSKSFPWVVRCALGTYFPPPNCSAIFVTAYGIPKARSWQSLDHLLNRPRRVPIYLVQLHNVVVPCFVFLITVIILHSSVYRSQNIAVTG